MGKTEWRYTVIRKNKITKYDETKVSRIDFGKHHHTISLRRIIIGVAVGFPLVLFIAIGVV